MPKQAESSKSRMGIMVPLVHAGIARIEAAGYRMDSWKNLITGLGTARDKTTGNIHEASAKLTYTQLEELYSGDDMAKRICEALPEDSLANGYDISISEDSEQGTDVAEGNDHESDVSSDMLEEHKRLNVAGVVEDGCVWARTFGGAVAIIGARDGSSSLAEPLNEERVESIDFLTCVDLQYVQVHQWYADSTHPKFGQPASYVITMNPVGPAVAVGPDRMQWQPGMLIVHESRLLVFDGERVTMTRRIRNNGWGDSTLQVVHDILGQFDMTWRAAGHLIQDSAQAKFKIDNLINMIGSNDPDILAKRMALVDLQRSISRAILLDAEKEDFTRDPLQLTGLPDTMDKMALRVAAAARMPLTKLMGQSPAGMNATGESDLALWDQCTAAYSRRKVVPPLERMTRLLFLAKSGPTSGKVPESFTVTMRKREGTATEIAGLKKTYAEIDAIEIASAMVLPEEAAMSRHTDKGWSPETKIDLKARRRMLEGNAAKTDPGSVEPGDDGDDTTDDATATPPVPTDPALPKPKATVPGSEPQPAAPPTAANVDPLVPSVADSEAALTGIQITAMMEIVSGVATGDIQRESGLAMLQVGLRLTEAQALAVLADAGGSFTVDKPEPPAPFGGGAPIGAKGPKPPKPEGAANEPPKQQAPAGNGEGPKPAASGKRDAADPKVPSGDDDE